MKYQCSFRDSLGAEQLLQAYRDKVPEAERDAIAADVETNAKRRIENQEVTLLVEGVNENKGFITLLIRTT